MQGTIASDQVGAAAALKMIRSVMIKGIEALTAECFLAAHRAGIVEEVAASLKNNYPGIDWPRSSNTISNAWRAMASDAPTRWRNPPPRCASLAWSP